EALYQKTLAAYRDAGRTKTAHFGLRLERLAWLYVTKGDTERAEECFRESLEVFRSADAFYRFLFYSRGLYRLASMYLARGEAVKGVPLIRESLLYHEQKLADTLPYQSERQRILSLRQSRRQLDYYLTVARQAPNVSAEELYSHVLAWKGAAGRQEE